METVIKDPDAVADFSLSWDHLFLDDDRIVSSAWQVESGGVTVVESTHTDTQTSVRLAGGTGTRAVVRNTVTTDLSRTDVQRLTIILREQ